MPEFDEDLAGYGRPVEMPNIAGGIPTTIQPQAMPAGYSERFGSPAPVIQAAVDQINDRLPVTALPSVSFSYDQQQAWLARMDEFDKQAKAARMAAQQAARDAQLLDQMSRVAKSTKDIEVALQQQDVIGFRNAVAGGVPPLQAFQRFPRAASAPLVSASIAASAPKPSWVAPTAAGAPGYVLDPRGVPHFPPGMEPQMEITPPKDLGGGVKVLRVSPQHLQVLDTGAAKKLPVDVAQEIAWRNADIKAAQSQREALLKGGTRADAPDIVKLDAAIEENKNAVRALNKPGSAPALAPTSKRVNVIGPDGRRGTVPQGSKLPAGWKLAP